MIAYERVDFSRLLSKHGANAGENDLTQSYNFVIANLCFCINLCFSGLRKLMFKYFTFGVGGILPWNY